MQENPRSTRGSRSKTSFGRVSGEVQRLSAARHMWSGPRGESFFIRVTIWERCGHMYGLSIRPMPLASMKSAIRGANQINALYAHCRAGLTRIGISSHLFIVCFCTLPLPTIAGQITMALATFRRPWRGLSEGFRVADSSHPCSAMPV